MEKCTYCVQRISRARITAKLEDRAIADGEVVPACAAACPTRAISFGNLKDARSVVNAWRGSSRHYVLLEELGTRPRTTYLAALANPLARATDTMQPQEVLGERPPASRRRRT
jgi:molybdopterin-containing oxidoreductase family iron-sulfur binding subunit